MILRRLTQSLKEQNWTAIVIEFVLLVSGVFLGIQVSNWNQARADRVEYETALSRLAAEIDTNLGSLDKFDPDISNSLEIGSRALTVLQSCDNNAESRRIVETGLDEIRGTNGLRLRRNALNEITSNPRLLPQQTARERQRFSELLFYFDALQAAADHDEFGPEESNWEENPILTVGAPFRSSSQYLGFDWVSTRRKLGLGLPVNEACRNNQLVKAFFNWERRQGGLPVISRKWRAELNATKAVIETRR